MMAKKKHRRRILKKGNFIKFHMLDGHPTWVFCRFWDIRKTYSECSELAGRAMPHGAYQHLETDYAETPGVKRLGFTNPRPIIILRKLEQGNMSCSRQVICDEGNVSFEEAHDLIEDGYPTQEEIRVLADVIRAGHEGKRRFLQMDGDFGGSGPGIRVCAAP
jgi:hypothetical protein